MISVNLTYIRHNPTDPASALPPKVLSFYDLTLVLKGTLTYVVDGIDVTVSDGEAIFFRPGMVRIRKASEEDTDYISFNFTADRVPPFPLHIKNAIHSEALFLISAYDKINRASYLDHTEENEHLLCLLLLVFEDRMKMQSFNPLTLKIVKYIDANLGNRITLEDIGRETFFSPIYCDTLFKREMGRSIIDYLLEKRIDEAKRLLLEGGFSLQKVAEVTGFRDYNYFSRVFKRRSGYSPTAFRRMVRDEGKE